MSIRFPFEGGRSRAVPLLLSAIAIFVYLIPGLEEWLQYDRWAIQGGQIWRLVTGHWTHTSFDHLLLDVVTFLALAIVCQRFDRRAFYRAITASLVLIPLALWTLQPALGTYRGLSGIDSALFVLATLLLYRNARSDRLPWARWPAGLALLLFAAKVAFELGTGQALFLQGSAQLTVVPLAHLAGALSGLLATSRKRMPQIPRIQGFAPHLPASGLVENHRKTSLRR